MLRRPNFVFILSDDQGWNGLSVEMHDAIPGSKSDFYRTPNLEKLASQGMRFSSAYAPSPVCSPTRVSLLTGKSPAQLHWTKAAPIMTAADGYKLIPPMHGRDISAGETTIAEVLKQAGYATAHFGKWHLGGGGPGRHGFDQHDGDTGNRDAEPFKDPNPVDIFGITERANAFMEKNTRAGTPFYVQLSHHALHYPEHSLKSTQQAYERRPKGRVHGNVEIAAMTENLDTGVGMVMDKIEQLSIADSTYLIYMSDNGSGGRSGRGPLAGGKGSLWEGGIRVPLIVRGPRVKPGAFCHVRVVGYDLFPTLCELAGVSQPLPPGVEGGSIVPLLADGKGTVKRPREELIFHFPHYQSGDGPHSTIFLGDYKLFKFYETDELRLFDLSQDVGERHNLAEEMPDKAAELHDRLDRYLKAVDAQMPVANPNYDPDKAPTERRGHERRGRRGGRRREEDLMTNDGQVVNSWTSQYEPGQSVYLLPNGHLLHCCFTRNPGFIGGGEGGRLEEYDWEGNLVWEYWCSDNEKLMHHDIEPMPNGNILAMVVEKKSFEECVAAGFAPNALRDRWLFPDYIAEIEPTRPKGGKVVWEWHVWDHLIQDNDPSKANYGDPAAHPELVSVDVNRRGAPAFWNHMNSIDYNPELDQVMLSVRGCSEIWVIDHSTTTGEARGHTGGRYGKGGDLLYRWGNPAAYGRGDARDQALFQQHDAQWIEPGCPGEGNILIFNNGLGRGYSTVDEIVPPADKNGNYILEPGSAYGPKKVRWTYVAENPANFFAEAISGAQRLPNGNTLICDGTSGIFFEVTPKGETVWEYVCPVAGEGPLKQGDPIPLDHRGHAMNAVFKIYRYPPDYPGLAGRDLTPKGLITGSTPSHVPENLSREPRPGSDRGTSRESRGRRGGGS